MDNTKNENDKPQGCTFVSQKRVEIAVEVVLEWINSKAEEEKSQPAEHGRLICLCFTLKTIPDTLKGISYIPVPHPPFPFDGSQKTCLIIGDGKEGLNVKVAERKIDEEGLPISKVFQHETFGDNIKLARSFDVFMVDKTVFSQVPSLLGPIFFSRKRNPIPVDLTHEQWRGQMESACTSAVISIRGSCCIVNAARASQTSKEIVENVAAVIEGLVSAVPENGRWTNISSMYLKSLDTLAFPLYYSSPEMIFGFEAVKRRSKTRKLETDVGKDVTGGLSSKKRTADEEQAPGAKKKKSLSSKGKHGSLDGQGADDRVPKDDSLVASGRKTGNKSVGLEGQTVAKAAETATKKKKSRSFRKKLKKNALRAE